MPALDRVTAHAPGFHLLGVSLSRGGHRVLRTVDAFFAAGEVTTITGGNGAGKSTLLHAMAGRLSPNAGTIEWRGADGGRRSGNALREIVGWLGHELGLYPDLTVGENLELHEGLRGVGGGAAVREIEADLALATLRDRRVRELSRGQRQRAALGRVLVSHPVAVLLDEPSTGLDVRAVGVLATLLVRVARMGACVVVVTHDELLLSKLDAATRTPPEGEARGLATRRFDLQGGALREVERAPLEELVRGEARS